MSGRPRWIIAAGLVLISLLLAACSNGAAATSDGKDPDTQAVPPGFATVTFTVPTIT